jgi:hypothetical protein
MMAIKIPVYLVNQTGPEWEKFKQQARQAGLDAQKAAAGVQAELAKRNTAEQATQYKKLADSLNQAAIGRNRLSQAVYTLNAFNITPYGYERFAYRASLAFEAVGKAALPIGAVIAAGATAVKSFNALLASGDAQAHRTAAAYREIGYAFDAMSVSLGRTEVFQSALKGLEDSFRKISEIATEGMPTIRGAWSVFWGDLEGARKAKRDIDEARAEVGRVRVRERREESEEFSRSQSIRSKLDAHKLTLDEISNEEKLTEMIREKNRELFDGAAKFEHTRDGEKRYAEFLKLTQGEIANLYARGNQLKQERKRLQEQLNDIEKHGVPGVGFADYDKSQAEISKEISDRINSLRESSKNGTLTAEKQKSELRAINDLLSKRKQWETEIRQIDEETARLKKKAADGEISDLKTVREAVQRQIDLEKQLNDELEKGKLSVRDELFMRRQILDLKARELELTRAIAGEVNTARKMLADTIRGRADIFSGKAQGPGQGLVGQLIPGQGRGDRDEIVRQLAQQRGAAIAEQQGITDPARVRQIVAGQMAGLRSGQIGIGSRDPRRRLSQTEMIEAQLQIGRRSRTLPSPGLTR